MSIVLLFYSYSTILKLPNYSSKATYFTHYGSYRTADPFDLQLLMQDTIYIAIHKHTHVHIATKKGLYIS